MGSQMMMWMKLDRKELSLEKHKENKRFEEGFSPLLDGKNERASSVFCLEGGGELWQNTGRI
jgi:hypothetical protein